MEVYEILLPLAIILVVSKVLMKCCEKIRFPAVIGMLLSGILVGLIRYIPGQTVLSATGMEGLAFFAKIGVILILFTAGLETDLQKIKSIGGPAVIITVAGVAVPMALGFLVATLCNGGFSALTKETLLQNLFYGTILTATSVSVTVATLREAGKLDSKVGTTVVAAAIIDDILGIVVLSFVLALKGDGAAATGPAVVVIRTLLYFVAVAIVAFLASKFFTVLDRRFEHHRLVPIMGIAFCFIIAYASEKWFGIADITGAYIVGLILSGNKDSHYIDRKADILGYMLFVPIFFANIGISTEFSDVSVSFLAFGALFILAGMAGKFLGCGAAALACGYKPKDAARVGLGMMARAEVALVTAQKGVEYGVIHSSIMPFVVSLILITSFVTPLLLHASYRKEVQHDTV